MSARFSLSPSSCVSRKLKQTRASLGEEANRGIDSREEICRSTAGRCLLLPLASDDAPGDRSLHARREMIPRNAGNRVSLDDDALLSDFSAVAHR